MEKENWIVFYISGSGCQYSLVKGDEDEIKYFIVQLVKQRFNRFSHEVHEWYTWDITKDIDDLCYEYNDDGFLVAIGGYLKMLDNIDPRYYNRYIHAYKINDYDFKSLKGGINWKIS